MNFVKNQGRMGENQVNLIRSGTGRSACWTGRSGGLLLTCPERALFWGCLCEGVAAVAFASRRPGSPEFGRFHDGGSVTVQHPSTRWPCSPDR